MSCHETSFKHNKQNKQFWSESTNSFMHQSSVLVASSSMMENLPFSFGWGWDVSLSLRRNLRVQPVQFCDGFLELWNSLDCTMGSCGEFFLLNTVQWHSALVSLFLFVTSAQNFTVRTLSSSCGVVCFKIYFSRWRQGRSQKKTYDWGNVHGRLMTEAICPWLSSLPRYFKRVFIMTINNKSERNYRGKCLGWPVTSYGGGRDRDFRSGSGTSFRAGGRSFIHCFVERVERLRMFIHSDRVKVFGLQCIASFETTGNLETCTFSRWLWICCCVSFVYAFILDSVSYGSWAEVEEKTPKYSSKWTLNGRNFL